MREELKIIKTRKVWNLVDLPSDSIPLGCREVYIIKIDQDGNIARYKSRLVAQGYRQVRGKSYEEVFYLVNNFSLIHFFFSLLVSYLGWSHNLMQCKECLSLHTNQRRNLCKTTSRI